MVNNYNVVTFIFKCLFICRAGVANFADNIEVLTMIIKQIFKESKKVKSFRSYEPECNL